jgi:flagellin-specific chaperone FliS
MKLLDNLIKQTSTYKHLDMLYMSALDELEQAQDDVDEIENKIQKSYEKIGNLKDILTQINTIIDNLDSKNKSMQKIKSLCKKGLK